MTVLTGSAHRREGRSARAVALGAAALGVVIFAVALALYLRYIRYDRVAALHVPPGVPFAMRLDVEQALLYEPARRHLLPLLGSPTASASQGDARLARIEDRTGLKRGDLRELVVARGPSRDDWVVVLGGIFPRGPGAQSIALALAAENLPWDLSADGSTATGPGGVAIARARDGVVVVASSEAMLAQAMTARPAPAVPLARTGVGTFAVDAAGVDELHQALAETGALAALLGHARAVTGRVSLGERIEVTVSVEVRPGEAAMPLTSAALEWLRTFGRTEATPGATLVRAGVERSAVTSVEAQLAQVEVTWEREEVDRAFAMAGDAVRDAFRSGTR